MPVGDFHHELNVDRLLLFLKHVLGHQQDTKDMALAGFYNGQMWEGKQEFVSSQKFDVNR